MFRRLTAIFLVCASLFGLVQPLMACTADMSMCDCCPGNPASGCTTETMPAVTVEGGACCAVSPAAATASFAAPLRSVDQPLHDGGAPDPFLITRLDTRPDIVFSTCVHAFTLREAPRADATLTYLYTARLRL